MAKSEFTQRILSALILIPIALIAIWYGGVAFRALLVIIGALMSWEMGRLIFGKDLSLSSLSLIATTIVVLCAQFFFHPFLALTCLAIGIGIGLFLAIIKNGPKWWTIFAYMFCVLPIIGLELIRGDEMTGLACTIWIFAIVWATDICAYFAGRRLGGPKLAPKFSPNKTWSGLGGGVLGAALCGLGAALLQEWSIAPLMVLSGLLALVAQGGDLLESHLKRRAGLKDSSNLIPGHGGVLDRLDGLIAVCFVGALIGIMRGGFDLTATGLITW